MGSCVSSNGTSSVPAATAKLILMDGSIKEFSEEVRSQEILQEYPGHFICNSDGLYVGQNISQVLGDDDQLQTGQLYFLFPQRKLQFVLTVPDMASLLFKINNAWLSAQKKRGRAEDYHVGLVKPKRKCSPFSIFIASMMNVERNTTLLLFVVCPVALILGPQLQNVEGKSNCNPSWRLLRRLCNRC
jgi:hypothetical protein